MPIWFIDISAGDNEGLYIISTNHLLSLTMENSRVVWSIWTDQTLYISWLYVCFNDDIAINKRVINIGPRLLLGRNRLYVNEIERLQAYLK